MRLSFANRDLPALTRLLDSLELAPAPSRARTHLLAALTQHLEIFSKDEYDLVCLYATLNEDGTPQVSPDGTVTLTDPATAGEFHTEHNTLLAEEMSVELADGKAATLLNALGASSQCFAGDDARALDLLAQSLEQDGQHEGREP